MKIFNRDFKVALPSFVENFFDNIFGSNKDANTTLPSVNIADEDAAFDLQVALPGLSKEDIKLEISNNVLVISAHKENSSEHKGVNWLRREFIQSSYYRAFSLPAEADTEKISAKMENGLLTIRVGKKKEALPASRSIKVQ
ncbi:Hsp20/alpha crystallin family protein [Rhodoflexus caldus]|uniref:Hsp20/alpha crystallin family protein n=1 Tax=Rhodoflexus caldus TaxID=2891236 RepID=UPI00202A67CC|nr:Hsp20/alpha crystallin family protein [Rhodoflexus caldus]